MGAPTKHKKWGGRVKGQTNKFTRSIKQVFEDVFNELQKDKRVCLSAWAKTNPTDYYKLISRLLPNAITGPDGGPLQVAGVVSVYMPDNSRRNDGPVMVQPPSNKPLRIQPRVRPGAS